MTIFDLQRHSPSVVRLGAGRGFLVQTRERLSRRLIVTAAHCLPSFPPCASISLPEERTYPDLIGHRGAEPSIWVECLFVDPIADIAVLGSVDDQALPDEAAAYDELTEEMQPFAFTEPRPSEPAYVLSLGGNWLEVRLNAHGRCLSLSPGSVVQSGMSGSPLVYADGSVVGVAVTNEGPHPMLAKATPRWCDLA